MQIAIVTGASSGIGKEFVFQLTKAYRNLDEIWVIARREERLVELQKKLPLKLRILTYDLTEEGSITALKELLAEEKPQIKVLVNSSGFGKRGYFEENSYEDIKGMIDLNCRSLTEITYVCIPYMSKGSRIIQLASSAAFMPQPNFAVYSASKSFVFSFSRALRRELSGKGIYVTTVCPGPVRTEFFGIADSECPRPMFKDAFMADPVKVVSKAIRDSHKKKEYSIYGGVMKAFYVLSKAAPHRVLIFFADKFFS
ncbi:SDR family NAD(P)-dependent oxidoreductase [Anaerobium acetethylicum]|uniref:NADP-dependent 3-hydroxy acid dehydrogenase YdfG n=1 Tax=Anaerobium acetethylicum TaxID=1619234 RepID=A0A1D3TNS0_9FIRM|nr:SDR family NAD(P)-dependent oxidoreductase [Anaerobium acetethylicum]SCP94970.1 hypothetical protein SAMN05421730_1001205 [Anaerobium acetethylicum]